MPYLEESYDVVVVGAGHAGCEAALSLRAAGAGDYCIYGECRQHCPDALQPQYRRKLQRPSCPGTGCPGR